MALSPYPPGCPTLRLIHTEEVGLMEPTALCPFALSLALRAATGPVHRPWPLLGPSFSVSFPCTST